MLVLVLPVCYSTVFVAPFKWLVPASRWQLSNGGFGNDTLPVDVFVACDMPSCVPNLTAMGQGTAIGRKLGYNSHDIYEFVDGMSM